VSAELDGTVRDELARGLLQLGVPATEAQQRALMRYLALMERWNAVYNLTAVRSPQAMVSHHLLDCLAAYPALRRELGAQTESRLIDVGSGAGLPGLLFAIMEPDLRVLCVDSVAKKVAFVRQAAAELGVRNATGLHARVEALRETARVVAARAYAPLDRLVASTSHLLERDGMWLVMKGKRPVQELAALPADVEVFHVEPLVVPGLAQDRCLVWMRRSARAGTRVASSDDLR